MVVFGCGLLEFLFALCATLRCCVGHQLLGRLVDALIDDNDRSGLHLLVSLCEKRPSERGASPSARQPDTFSHL